MEKESKIWEICIDSIDSAIEAEKGGMKSFFFFFESNKSQK